MQRELVLPADGRLVDAAQQLADLSLGERHVAATRGRDEPRLDGGGRVEPGLAARDRLGEQPLDDVAGLESHLVGAASLHGIRDGEDVGDGDVGHRLVADGG